MDESGAFIVGFRKEKHLRSGRRESMNVDEDRLVVVETHLDDMMFVRVRWI